MSAKVRNLIFGHIYSKHSHTYVCKYPLLSLLLTQSVKTIPLATSSRDYYHRLSKNPWKLKSDRGPQFHRITLHGFTRSDNWIPARPTKRTQIIGRLFSILANGVKVGRTKSASLIATVQSAGRCLPTDPVVAYQQSFPSWRSTA